MRIIAAFSKGAVKLKVDTFLLFHPKLNSFRPFCISKRHFVVIKLKEVYTNFNTLVLGLDFNPVNFKREKNPLKKPKNCSLKLSTLNLIDLLPIKYVA